METIKNKQIAQVLNEIADILEMKEEKFKPIAYRKAAREIESFPKSVSSIDDINELKEIPGVGDSIAKKIMEISNTGTCNYCEQLKKQIPADVVNLTRIEGVGPKTIKRLYDELGVKTVKDLEKAAENKKIRNLEGFGEKTEKNILKGIRSFRKRSTRFMLGEALAYAEKVINQLRDHDNTVKVEVAGSIRRRKETIGDIDILLVSKDSEDSMNYFTNLESVSRIIGKGKTKSTIEFDNGLQADLRIIDKGSWGAAMLYFTGDKSHNIKLRQKAIKSKFKLNEYGLFNKKGKTVAGKSEEEIYQKLGMKTPPPEIRRDNGEIEVASEHNLPNLIKEDDIKGDLQMHTVFSDGVNTPKEMADAASKLGYEYIAITEHNTEGLEVAGGVDSKDVPKYIKKIKSVKSKTKILPGLEVNIAQDGLLTVEDRYLKLLDFVLIAIHSNFRMGKDEMTKRILRAFDNRYVNSFAHPTGKLLLRRDGYEFDFEAVCKKAEKRNICLELNAYPERLDLNGEQAKLAKKYGCKFSIGTDSHSVLQLQNIKYAVYMARRGWLEKKDIINSMNYKKLLKYLKRKK